MNTDQARIDELIAHLSESLTVEVKRWISIDDPNGISKIVRGVLALRNRNGGYFVIGFDDKTLQPDTGNEPSDVRLAFHPDKVQGLVSRYASELFEVSVAFGQREGREYPVIVVPPGVKSPVAAKAELRDDKKNTLIRLARSTSERCPQMEYQAPHWLDLRIGWSWLKSALTTAKPISVAFSGAN